MVEPRGHTIPIDVALRAETPYGELIAFPVSSTGESLLPLISNVPWMFRAASFVKSDFVPASIINSDSEGTSKVPVTMYGLVFRTSVSTFWLTNLLLDPLESPQKFLPIERSRGLDTLFPRLQAAPAEAPFFGCLSLREPKSLTGCFNTSGETLFFGHACSGIGVNFFTRSPRFL
jgi:hypothetical protein